MQVKATLRHGEFGGWLLENINVSERQAQRYMRSAKGLPVLRTITKTDTVSDLKNDADLVAQVETLETETLRLENEKLQNESIARIVANAVAEQMAIERAKMIEEFEREKQPKETELDLLAKGINTDFESFKQNRDGLISDLIKMKSLHVGAYWQNLVEVHYSKSIAEVLFSDYSTGDMDLNDAIVTTDVVHASLVAQIEAVEMLRNQKDWTGLEFESFDDFVVKNSIDLDHFERYKQMPIYSEIVESIKAYKIESAEV